MGKCPRDGGVLAEKKIGGVEGKTCPACGGIWLSYDAVKRLYDGGRISAPSKFYSDFRPDFEYNCRASDLRCPDDDRCLTTYEFKSIQIDICHTCKGLWLDKGEIKKLGVEDSNIVELLIWSPDIFTRLLGF